MTPTILIIAVFIFGTIIGSFLNVCIVRLPANTSIVFPASHCPNCGAGIRGYDNIPLVSYILLGGRCRACKNPIALRYFIVELLMGVLSAVLFVHFGLSLVFVLCFVFTAALVVITFIDLQHQIIPDRISLPGIPLAFLCSFVLPWNSWLDSLLGILAGGGILYAFALGYYLLTRKEGMGGGDIKMLAMIGAFLGWKGALATLMLAAVAGSIIGVILMALKGKDFKYAVPFGPFLALGAFCTLLYGDSLISWYLSIGMR
jgi:leader peptidase (prepilin peptidase) / N-methyltransferase